MLHVACSLWPHMQTVTDKACYQELDWNLPSVAATAFTHVLCTAWQDCFFVTH